MTRDAKLGCRSKTVLDQLGRDLRSYFDKLMNPTPLLLQGLLDELRFAVDLDAELGRRA